MDRIKVNPVQIQRFLEGLDYPATKDEIIEHARAEGADDNVIATLEQIPDREYEGPSGVSRELGQME
ncbi:MAG: DUF2795 domain-containing protein [bacterium]|nr:DUF2795 domain-containing protein [bacterium]MDZ4296415.1 DUF2795 domain-containing protein [Patescibacteria group bacterium]